MKRVDDSELYEIAKRTLGIPAHKQTDTIPIGYLQELRTHVNFSKDDTNFRVFPQPGYGYGTIQCLEKACGEISFALTKNKEENIDDGIGSLSVFRIHATQSTHVVAQQARVLAANQTPVQDAPKPKIGVRASSSSYAPVTMKQEPSENINSEFVSKISHPVASNKNPKIKHEDSTINLILGSSQSLQMVKQENSYDSATSSGAFVNNYVVSTIPSKKRILAHDEDDSLFKKAKMESFSDHKPFSSTSRLPLSEVDGNVKLPLFKSVPEPVSADLMDIKPEMRALASKVLPPSHLSYGDVDEKHHLEFTMHSNDLNTFINQAGNAEFFDGNASVDKALERLGLAKLGEPLPYMSVPLLPHQIIGVCWMLEHERGPRKGGILADEMGLGKTVQMIATIIQHRSDDPAVKSTLVCVPLALLDQWKLEIELKTNDHLSCLVYYGSNKAKSVKELQKYDIVITTYGTLTTEWPDDSKLKQRRKISDDDFIVADAEAEKMVKKKGLGPLMKIKWFRVVLDEAQLIRNKQTRTSNAVTELDAIHRWCLTGTPIINTLTDCYSHFRFLKLRPWSDWADFREHISRHEHRSPSLAATRLQAILNTCVLRRRKDTVLDGRRLIELPPKEVCFEELVFTKEEREIYDVVEKKSQVIFNRYLRAGTVLKNYSHVFVLLLRLRQICGHPALIQENADAFARPEDDTIIGENQSEIHRAIILCGKEFVEKMQEKRKEVITHRIEAEKTSLNARIEDEDCPVCFDAINTPVITSCGHSFCKDCLELVMSQPGVTNEAAEIRYASADRPCPTCRFPIVKEKIFLRSAFEPVELNPVKIVNSDHSDDDDGMPIDASIMTKKNHDNEDSDTKTRIQRNVKRRSYASLDSDSDDSFIVHTDEDDEDYEPKKRSNVKRNIVYSSDDDDEVLAPPKIVKRRTRKMKGERRKLLPSTKLKRMMELLKMWAEAEQTQNEKTIVVSQWTSLLDLTADYLDEHGFTYVRYQGDMSRTQREQTVRTFMANGKARVLLMSMKGGGVGLNLTRANHVISLDLGWSPAVEQQAFDRVHRLGQTRNVTIHPLVIQETVEARILALQARKQDLIDGSLGEGKAAKLSRLSVRDLANLFGLRA